ncbi:MAG: sodium-extruding oxaloacetate decarboxylase subunit alpha [Gammaproteobacteria bacterium]|nr:sodium-extruding oxaloacetate decarboxylase subunit alpha [Gammaproteobacteria bacterium]
MKPPLAITELALRDAHQSLLATRMRIDDMLPIAQQLDEIGYWSIEMWGGATFDACIRYLGEDPWQRLRLLKQALPNTQTQMLLRAQNILGYRHYADDVVHRFIERAAENGMDVFRIFDALNDLRNMKTAIAATVKVGKHAQGAISYTVSPVHSMDRWVDLGKALEEMGCHSLCIKDMAGLLKPYVAFELVSRLKEVTSIPIALHAHATTGLSTTTLTKAVEAGLDIADCAISSMSHTYGHSATESLVSIVEEQPRATGLDLEKLEEIATYFRKVRKKYGKFEGSLRGVDSRILTAQVPGGMLTNMENQLRQQNALHRFDEVLEEIPRVRRELGYIPLVTPTSQIVGTQAVINILGGKRYATITKETSELLKGHYGETPAAVDQPLQQQVLKGEKAITCRPADLLQDELQELRTELEQQAKEGGFELAEEPDEDLLIYALFPQVGLKFLQNRHNPDAFEPAPWLEANEKEKSSEIVTPTTPPPAERYSIQVNGKQYEVVVAPGGTIDSVTSEPPPSEKSAEATSPSQSVVAPMAGTIFKVLVVPGKHVNSGDVLIIMEAMKMETEIRASHSGNIATIEINEGDAVIIGQTLITLV